MGLGVGERDGLPFSQGPLPRPALVGSIIRLGSGGVGVCSSKGTVDSVLKARSFSWPELCHMVGTRVEDEALFRS